MREKLNIILIVMDAVRAQNLSCYGYERKTTPLLDSNILPQSVLYKNAVSSSYWTLPSFASTFTGTYLSRHGLVVDGDVLDPKFITMAEFLKSNGYVTCGLCNSVYVSSFSGLDRGFDIFYDYRFFNRSGARASPLYKLSKRISKKNKQSESSKTKKEGFLEKFEESVIYKRLLWFLTRNLRSHAEFINTVLFRLIQRSRKKPFFMFVHYPETHSPYVLPKPYREKYLTNQMKGKKPWEVNQDWLKYFLGAVKMDDLDFSILEALYNGAINYLDERIYEIYSFLDKEQLLSDTMLIITSDHGDNLGEHNMMFHWWCLYDTLIKIPLIIKYPEDLNLCGEENNVVQNVDLLPTIMDIIGAKDENLYDQVQGNSLFSGNIIKRSGSYGISELMKPFGPSIKNLSTRFEKYNRRLISIRSKDKKYIWASDGRDEFYDLESDPSESRNLVNSNDPLLTESKEKLKPWLKAFQEIYLRNKEKINGVKKMEFTYEIKDRLRKLGYL